jgi:heme A synthase
VRACALHTSGSITLHTTWAPNASCDASGEAGPCQSIRLLPFDCEQSNCVNENQGVRPSSIGMVHWIYAYVLTYAMYGYTYYITIYVVL